MVNLTKEQFEKLAESRANTWAIWDESFEKESKSEAIDYHKVASKLKPHIIFLGLNPSKELEKHNLINFHNPKSANDRKLKRAIQGEKGMDLACPHIFGGFMTDIIVDTFEANSANIDITNIDKKEFESKLEDLGQKSYHLICFGHKVYNAVQKWLLKEEKGTTGLVHGHLEVKDWDIKIYRVTHFAASVKIETFNEQLREVDTLIGR